MCNNNVYWKLIMKPNEYQQIFPKWKKIPEWLFHHHYYFTRTIKRLHNMIQILVFRSHQDVWKRERTGKFLNGVRNESSGWLRTEKTKSEKVNGTRDSHIIELRYKNNNFKNKNPPPQKRMETSKAPCHHHPSPPVSMRGKHEEEKKMRWNEVIIRFLKFWGMIKLKNKQEQRWIQCGLNTTDWL